MDANVYSVQEASIGDTQNDPAAMIMVAVGMAPTSGWTNARLVPRVYFVPTEDGICDFIFSRNM